MNSVTWYFCVIPVSDVQLVYAYREEELCLSLQNVILTLGINDYVPNSWRENIPGPCDDQTQ